MTRRILVVDDEYGVCDILDHSLSRAGYLVKTAVDGEEALKIIPEWQPDLVILDVMMPKIDGFEVLRRLRKFDRLMNVPVVMLTARSSLADKESGFGTGADDYIVKPFVPKEVIMRVEAIFRRGDMSVEAAQIVPQSISSLPIVIHRYPSGVFQKSYMISKRLFDIVMCLLMLPFAALVCLVVALIVRIDSPGPILFVQERTGMNGHRFKMYKFRTMYQNAEELKQKYLHLNELTWPDFKITNDPRITKVGKFLRRTSLDELPQLINILIGDMSFVGPRPTSFSSDTYNLWHTERLEVRPGLTGLWQISGRADVDFDDRVELDIEYIERQSWKLDLMILIETFTAVLTSRGAH